jgi:hypothetical protein
MPTPSAESQVAKEQARRGNAQRLLGTDKKGKKKAKKRVKKGSTPILRLLDQLFLGK